MTFWRSSKKPVLQHGWLIGISLFLIAALLPLTPALAQDAGQIVSVLGTAEVLREGRWQPLSAEQTLAPGDTVRTGAGSRMAIQLSNGAQIKLNANSRLEFKQIAPPVEDGFLFATTQALQNLLRILSGEVWVRSGGEPLEIETVYATATVRGTEFNLAVDPGDLARLTVLTGLIEFRNPQGSVLVAANEQATAKRNEAPRKTVLLNPLDAVQWSLYYPDPIGGPKAGDPRHNRIQAAQRDLQQGRVNAARQTIDQALALDPNDADAYSLRSTIALVQNRKTEALADAQRAVATNPASAAAYLSLSLAHQARFDLNAALVAAQKAVELEPNNPRALVQESSLLFGMGRRREATQVAEQARQRAPNDAMVNTVWGFLQLANNRIDAAREAFQTAIAQDSTIGLPHVGLGLALFRRNQTEAAVDEIRKATLLEPQVSLYSSYLGKAFYEIKDDRRAEKYLELAKQLDPRDPTPWLYDAIRLQSINQPIAAVENLQKSIELNDDRGVYRSRLLLDEDLAARSATLGRVYNEVGFTELGLQEGRQSVSLDPTNYSAHRLLADSYFGPGMDTARVSELLQAQLLQPINITPVQPQMAETKLLIPNAGPLTPSLYEFNPLFVRNRPTLFFSGLGGNQDAWGDEVIVSGLTDRFSYSLGQFHYQSNGYRTNDDLENNLYNLFVQAAVTPDLSLQAEYRHRETIYGDLRSIFDGSFRSSERNNLDQDTARIGAHYSLSPQTDVIASVIYVDQKSVTKFPSVDATIGARNSGAQAEAQLIHKADGFNIITGLKSYSADVENLDSPSSSNNSDSSISQQMAYSYVNVKIPDQVIWTLGLSYESDQELNVAGIHQFNPKLGVQWALNDQVSLRAAAFQFIKPSLVFQQTIEPTQVAGFNQFADYINMTVAKNYGLGLDVRFNQQLFGGLEALRRDTDIPFGIYAERDNSPYEITHNQENFYRAYLYWLPSPHWAVATSWLYEEFEADENCQWCLFWSPAQLKTISLPLNIQYFNPSGFFSGLGITYVNQDVEALDFRSPELNMVSSHNEFTLVNASLGYRLPKRWGIIALQANNLFDRKFNFQDYSFQTPTGITNPLYIPERTVYARLILNF